MAVKKWCANRPSMNKLKQEIISGIDSEPQSSTLSENEEMSEPSSRRLKEIRTRQVQLGGRRYNSQQSIKLVHRRLITKKEGV
jgi:tRNA pseudouridine-54 N-methylase